ncbi:MAG: lysoplasmalogenase [Oscillospiraceae bacterium]|nr:lysoplasmalogenase [Oscillospiraceae bacterium]
MPTTLWIPAISCMTLALITAIFRDKGMERARLVAKTLASLSFCALGLLAAGRREGGMSSGIILLLSALALGMLGDVLLALDKFIQPEARTLTFILGGTPFFVGHIFYIAVLLPAAPLDPWLLLFLPAVPLLFAGLNYGKLLVPGKAFVPLLIYGLMLGGMVMATLNTAKQGGALGRLMWAPGILFAVSDSALFIDQFGGEKTKKLRHVYPYLIMLTYYSAQMLFAVSAMYL